jgi:allophanate hydrolase
VREIILSTIESMQTASGAAIGATLGVGALRTAFRAGRLRPTDVVEEILDRIAARGEDHVWISRVPDDDLLRAAAAADPEAPLGGIPFAVKDNIDTAGLPTTAACPDFSY